MAMGGGGDEGLLTPLTSVTVRRLTVGALVAGVALFAYGLPETDERGHDHVFSGVKRALNRVFTVPISDDEQRRIREYEAARGKRVS